MTTGSRRLAVRGAHNIRDLGGYLTASGKPIPWRRFLRSDSLHRLGEGEAERLHAIGLRAVIDLRTAAEVERAPSPFAAYPDVHFVNLPMFDDLAPAALSQAKSDAAHPLLAFYDDALETRGPAIRRILSEIAAVRDGAVLFNCTAGKDRTGLVAALLLGLAGVGRDEIVEDYALTADFISELVEEFLGVSRANGGDVESYARLLESPAFTMAKTLDRIASRYGTVEGYLRHVGTTQEEIDALRARLAPGEDAP